MALPRIWHNPAFVVPLPAMPPPSLSYLHLHPHEELPPLESSQPFLAVLVIDEVCEEMWRWEACRWLAATNCRFLLAWGKYCEDWAESAADAQLEAFDYEDIPPDRLLMTTSHEDEDLEEVFWFARHRARHPALQLAHTVIVQVGGHARKQELEALYTQS